MSQRVSKLSPSLTASGPRRRMWLEELPKHALLLVLLVLTFYPFVAMLVISGKTYAQFTTDPFTLSIPFHWENFAFAWSRVAPYIGNSLIVSVGSGLGVLILSSLSAFIFARYRFPGREFLFYLIISLLLIPGILTLIPQFVLVRDLHLLNTRWALILPYISGGQVFGIFLLRSYFAALPEELFEAARLDGAGEMTILTRIVLPLSWSILGTLAILHVLGTWNDLIWPVLVINDDSLKTVVTGIASYQGQYASDWGLLMAAYTLASLPLLLLFMVTSRYFIAGLASGALKA